MNLGKLCVVCMMKCLSVLVVLFCCLQLLNAANDNQADYAKARMDCLDEMKLSKDDKELILSYKYLQLNPKIVHRNMLCFPLCFYKRLGYVDEKTMTYNRAAFEANLMDYLKGDKARVARTLDNCKDIKGADDCVKAFNNEVCFAKENQM